MIYLRIINIFIIYTFVIHCDATLQRTLGTELKMSRHVESHVGQLATTVGRVERVIDKLLSARWSHMDKADYVTTPLTAMVLVRRLVQDWLPLTAMVGRFSKLHYLQLDKVRWPTVKDLDGSARAMVRSQMTYDLSTALLVRGVQRDMFLTNVTAADCLEIARQYFLRDRFSEAIEWLQHALAGTHDSGDAPFRETVLHYMAAALCFSGDAGTSINVLRNIFKENPFSKPPEHLSAYYNIMGTRGCMHLESEMLMQLDSHSHDGYVKRHYYRNNTAIKEHSRLCQGQSKTDSRLACRYVHYHQPHLRFQPFKLEELQLDPPVLRFYDFVSDKEAESLKIQAKHKMGPARTGPPGQRQTSEYRTSLVAWLSPNDTEWLSRRMFEATLLDTKTAESHQVSRYSVSGEYLPHRDHIIQGVEWVDDRIATLMIYLNDVDQGGHTVFNNWELSVPPVRNSAVVWFNYKPNGEPDIGSWHCGCPVLKGTKWVLNKWFHNAGNHVNFPCTIDQEGSFKGFYL